MSKRKSADQEQSQAFVQAARDLGADESEEAFDKVLKRIASAPPPRSVQKRKATSSKRRKNK